MAVSFEAKIKRIHRRGEVEVVVRLYRTDGPYTGIDESGETFEYYNRTPIGDGEYTFVRDAGTTRLGMIADILSKMAEENTRLKLEFKLSDRICTISSI
jgi:hypothetical protein